MAQVFQPGTHGTTFGGNPLAATVANAVLAHLDAPLLAGVGERHALIVDQLNAISPVTMRSAPCAAPVC
nr:aminotransferase class III-fold pyridoxal phosphate-dependent enzyme [Klebsiella pneumoniae subsp. pneumoniae]